MNIEVKSTRLLDSHELRNECKREGGGGRERDRLDNRQTGEKAGREILMQTDRLMKWGRQTELKKK